MPREVRVRAHYAVRLVTVAVADKQNLNHGSVKPPNGTFCRDLRREKIVHSCRKTGPTWQIAAMDGSQMVVENQKVYYHVRSFSDH